jgi:hypothetical protein
MGDTGDLKSLDLRVVRVRVPSRLYNAPVAQLDRATEF